jgi:hypothetical protein
VCFALLLHGCGTRTETELAKSSSPDKTTVASLVQVDSGGGATVGFITDVYLSEAGKDRGKSPLFSGYSCGPVSITWEDDRTLQIHYQSHCHITKFENEWWTGTDTTSPRMVELVLKRGDGNGP